MLTILCYHGVTKEKSDGIENYSQKHIHYETFKKQLNIIKNSYQVISMNDVIQIYKKKIKIKDKLLAITFDDGFKNNIEVAAPILDNYNFEATFYVTSGLINTNNLFWVDQLENSINSFEGDHIKIMIKGEASEFSTKSKKNKIETLNKIKIYCKNSMNSEKNRIVDFLNKISFSDHTNTRGVQNYNLMNWSDIKTINESNNFVIGGHSLKHDLFSKIELESDLKYDIKLSIELIQKKLGQKVIHYSYPEGQNIHFNKKVIEILKSNKILCCPSAIDGINKGSEDLFTLKRIMPNFMGRQFPIIES